MRLISFEDYTRIFFQEFDSELLLNIVKLFQEMVLDNEQFNTPTEQRFSAQVLAIVGKTPGFDFVLSFLMPEEKDKVCKVAQALADGLKDAEEKEVQEDVSVLMKQFLS